METLSSKLTVSLHANHKKHMHAKGQLISKKNVKPRILQKTERMNSLLLVCDVFSFVFLKNPQPEKKRFEIIWPLNTTSSN